MTFKISVSVNRETVVVLEMTKIPHHRLPPNEKITQISIEIMGIIKNFYPCKKGNNCALLLLDLLRDGSIYGEHGVAAMIENRVAFGKDRLKAWSILQGLYMDDYDGSFGIVEILRKVEGLEEFQRGVFPGKSTIWMKAKELEKYVDSYLPYKCYRFSTGHRNIKLKY